MVRNLKELPFASNDILYCIHLFLYPFVFGVETVGLLFIICHNEMEG